MVTGDLEAATVNYKKSIELNPENENGKNMLEKVAMQMEAVKNKVKIPAKVLNSYAGRYEVPPGMILHVFLEEDKLFGQPEGEQRVELFPISETTFLARGVDAKVIFKKDEDGMVKGFDLTLDGQEMQGKKLD